MNWPRSECETNFSFPQIHRREDLEWDWEDVFAFICWRFSESIPHRPSTAFFSFSLFWFFGSILYSFFYSLLPLMPTFFPFWYFLSSSSPENPSIFGKTSNSRLLGEDCHHLWLNKRRLTLHCCDTIRTVPLQRMWLKTMIRTER